MILGLDSITNNLLILSVIQTSMASVIFHLGQVVRLPYSEPAGRGFDPGWKLWVVGLILGFGKWIRSPSISIRAEGFAGFFELSHLLSSLSLSSLLSSSICNTKPNSLHPHVTSRHLTSPSPQVLGTSTERLRHTWTHIWSPRYASIVGYIRDRPKLKSNSNTWNIPHQHIFFTFIYGALGHIYGCTLDLKQT